MRITEKGQVTIPKAVRDHLGIGPGSEVDFIMTREGVQVVKLNGGDGRRLGAEEIERHLANMRGTIDTEGMDGRAYIERLRGPRDDFDVG
ncbi:AbrB/MazE/SpoVT family DNA-binding domain-containing protein [Consotaella aegiceratis]|uniref:AbrB/MazE/SpoVT family DNA-binding domain-containing protein n=1 Tax=Consotaella aegiceratis TaxID=3097961 RepID=UPI002F414E10